MSAITELEPVIDKLPTVWYGLRQLAYKGQGPGACHVVSAWLERQCGLRMVGGCYDYGYRAAGPNEDGWFERTETAHSTHCWAVADDGTIIDGTVGQFWLGVQDEQPDDALDPTRYVEGCDCQPDWAEQWTDLMARARKMKAIRYSLDELLTRFAGREAAY